MAILATSSEREEVAVSLHRGAATSASLEERLSPRQRVLYGQLMDRLVSGGPLELSAEEEELLACLPDEHRSGPGRPPAITRQVGRWIVALAKLPYSFGEICRTMGVSYSVYKRVRQDYPGFAAVLTYARTVRIARIAETRERAIQVAVATGDWRAIEQVYLDEVRRMARERAEDPWADPEQLAEAIAERLREMVGGDGAAGPAGGVRGAPGPEPEPAAAVADERTGDALHRP